MYYCYKNGNQNDKVTGLVKISGKTYYFSPKTETYNSIQHGTQTVTRKYQQRVGWVKINNDYYYFNPKYGKDGYMLTGTTKDEVTLGSDGKAKISSNQNDYINRKLMIMVRANDVVNAITNPDDTNNVKLRKCFNYVSGIPYSSYSSPIPLAGVTDYNYVENKEEAKFFDIEMAIYPLFSDKESIKSWANGSSVLSARESRRTVLIDAYGRRFGTNPKGGEVGDCFACSCAFAYLANAIGYTDVKVVFSIWQSHCWNSIGGQKYDVVNSPQVFGTQKENFSPAWTKDVSTGEIKRT